MGRSIELVTMRQMTARGFRNTTRASAIVHNHYTSLPDRLQHKLDPWRAKEAGDSIWMNEPPALLRKLTRTWSA
jgi:hypothetical protein